MGDGDESFGNGVNVFETLFHFWCQNTVTNFSLCLLAHDYHVAFQLVKNVLYMDVDGGFLVNTEKLFCSHINSDCVVTAIAIR